MLEKMIEIKEAVDKNIVEVLDDSKWADKLITPILKEYALRGGKRIRPLATFVTAEMFGETDAAKILPTATAFELLHNGTLMHDDIIDESDLRRNRPTMHVEHGLGMTILVTDYLLGIIYAILTSNISILGEEKAKKILDLVNNSFITITRGQALEFDASRTPTEADEDTIIEILLGKTASLFQACLLAGAIIAGGASEEQLNALAEYSEGIGVSFQLQDDVLNVMGDEKYGKEIGGDILEGKATLLLCKAWQKASEDQKNILRTIFAKTRDEKTTDDASEAISIYKKLGVIDEVAVEARKWQERSIKVLEKLPQGDAKDVLEFLARYAVERSF
ncbi:MAG: polyprenyl synthetase family protein [Candidatus Hodarchaeales archaeon]|jgi:geranylgeranyl pyrophosphate synthase